MYIWQGPCTILSASYVLFYVILLIGSISEEAEALRSNMLEPQQVVSGRARTRTTAVSLRPVLLTIVPHCFNEACYFMLLLFRGPLRAVAKPSSIGNEKMWASVRERWRTAWWLWLITLFHIFESCWENKSCKFCNHVWCRMLTGLPVALSLQYVWILNQYIAHLKLTQCCMSIVPRFFFLRIKKKILKKGYVGSALRLGCNILWKVIGKLNKTRSLKVPGTSQGRGELL